jgi:hypothetical protein
LQLKKEARKANLAASSGRIKSDWIEPETLFWASWHALSGGERAELAKEAISGFLEHVENAASKDPRKPPDPMEAHRHRIHPLLWKAARDLPLDAEREARLFREREDEYLARRPKWSVTKAKPPWDEDVRSR